MISEIGGRGFLMKFSERASIERRVFFYLCGFALSSSLSLAGSSIIFDKELYCV